MHSHTHMHAHRQPLQSFWERVMQQQDQLAFRHLCCFRLHISPLFILFMSLFSSAQPAETLEYSARPCFLPLSFKRWNVLSSLYLQSRHFHVSTRVPTWHDLKLWVQHQGHFVISTEWNPSPESGRPLCPPFCSPTFLSTLWPGVLTKPTVTAGRAKKKIHCHQT